ncbi:MAG: HlyD family secretion protein [Methyloceanibacter sp.]|jgi:multidrug resistance efflux pump
MQRYLKISVTTAAVLVAIVLISVKYWAYVTNPWTRDGQVRANVIEVAPRVSGPIVNLPIKDNQFVKAGDLLFEIDPRTFEAAVREARANLDSTIDDLTSLDRQIDGAKASVAQYEAVVSQARSKVTSAQAELDESQKQYDRSFTLLQEGDTSQARFDIVARDRDVALANERSAQSALLEARAALMQARANLESVVAQRGAIGEKNPKLRAARSALETAQLNLDFTKVRASVDGFVTNLQPRVGSQAVANQPIMALVDSGSFWVDAYFRETFVKEINPGDRVAVTLMSYPDTVLEGVVDSLGWGIAQSDGSTGSQLLPNVSPTFEWIRLAQRIPVRIVLDELPEGIELRVGTTASVLVMAGDDTRTGALPPPAPAILQ